MTFKHSRVNGSTDFDNFLSLYLSEKFYLFKSFRRSWFPIPKATKKSRTEFWHRQSALCEQDHSLIVSAAQRARSRVSQDTISHSRRFWEWIIPIRGSQSFNQTKLSDTPSRISIPAIRRFRALALVSELIWLSFFPRFRARFSRRLPIFSIGSLRACRDIHHSPRLLFSGSVSCFCLLSNF
jgi:hypothetical protein